jgi:hypothetical protein
MFFSFILKVFDSHLENRGRLNITYNGEMAKMPSVLRAFRRAEVTESNPLFSAAQGILPLNFGLNEA